MAVVVALTTYAAFGRRRAACCVCGPSWARNRRAARPACPCCGRSLPTCPLVTLVTNSQYTLHTYRRIAILIHQHCTARIRLSAVAVGNTYTTCDQPTATDTLSRTIVRVLSNIINIVNIVNTNIEEQATGCRCTCRV